MLLLTYGYKKHDYTYCNSSSNNVFIDTQKSLYYTHRGWDSWSRYGNDNDIGCHGDTPHSSIDVGAYIHVVPSPRAEQDVDEGEHVGDCHGDDDQKMSGDDAVDANHNVTELPVLEANIFNLCRGGVIRAVWVW